VLSSVGQPIDCKVPRHVRSVLMTETGGWQVANKLIGPLAAGTVLSAYLPPRWLEAPPWEAA
jgi:hypothetical protein